MPISWGGVRGVNVSIYGSPMECLGIILWVFLLRVSGEERALLVKTKGGRFEQFCDVSTEKRP